MQHAPRGSVDTPWLGPRRRGRRARVGGSGGCRLGPGRSVRAGRGTASPRRRRHRRHRRRRCRCCRRGRHPTPSPLPPRGHNRLCLAVASGCAEGLARAPVTLRVPASARLAAHHTVRLPSIRWTTRRPARPTAPLSSHHQSNAFVPPCACLRVDASVAWSSRVAVLSFTAVGADVRVTNFRHSYVLSHCGQTSAHRRPLTHVALADGSTAPTLERPRMIGGSSTLPVPAPTAHRPGRSSPPPTLPC